MNVFVGVDPGLDGAIAGLLDGKLWVFDAPTKDVPYTKKLSKKKSAELGVKTLDTTRREIDVDEVKVILNFLISGTDSGAGIIEKVSARPGNGGTSMFRFGDTFGVLRCALAWYKSLGFKIHEPLRPQEWKKILWPNMPKKMSKKDQKTFARKYVMEKFPDMKDEFKLVKHDGRAEAVCIALCVQQIYSGVQKDG